MKEMKHFKHESSEAFYKIRLSEDLQSNLHVCRCQVSDM